MRPSSHSIRQNDIMIKITNFWLQKVKANDTKFGAMRPSLHSKINDKTIGNLQHKNNDKTIGNPQHKINDKTIGNTQHKFNDKTIGNSHIKQYKKMQNDWRCVP